MATEITNIRMEPAENGVIITYDESTKSPGDVYGPRNFKTCKKVFDWDEDDDAEAEKKKAMDCFLELAKSGEEGE